MTHCPKCGRPVYRCLSEHFTSTGSLRAETVYRHEDTERIACGRVGDLWGKGVGAPVPYPRGI